MVYGLVFTGQSGLLLLSRAWGSRCEAQQHLICSASPVPFGQGHQNCSLLRRDVRFLHPVNPPFPSPVRLGEQDLLFCAVCHSATIPFLSPCAPDFLAGRSSSPGSFPSPPPFLDHSRVDDSGQSSSVQFCSATFKEPFIYILGLLPLMKFPVLPPFFGTVR